MGLAILLAGCGSDGGTPRTPTPRVSSENVGSTNDGDPASAGSAGTTSGRKRIVLLDPGHNGGDDPVELNRQVTDGRQGTNACNTAGTSTDDGYPEHRFDWDVAKRVRALLNANGIIVAMTRENDTGAGPCVDVRGTMAEKIGADLMVSIHAYDGPPTGSGYHVSYSSPPLNEYQGQPSLSLATALRDALRGAGLQPSSHSGTAGLLPRADLAGLNLARRPAALVECANMHNPQEAVVISNAIGRQRYANAIAAGIMAWLSGH